jgi:hypothetical protein
MDRMYWRCGVALACVLLGSGGCGDDDDDDPATTGDQCRAVLSAFCDRAVECGAFPQTERNDCVNAGVDGCCGSRCSGEAASSESSIRECTDRMDRIECDALLDDPTGSVPSQCVGVVKAASVQGVTGDSPGAHVGGLVSSVDAEPRVE